MSQQPRIALLDNRLANQIAAGEVVERPASVVKELIENSIDAGASRIEVDIERGGARLIRIIDNGHGIHKDDLGLSLTRHATSKISTTDDLANIRSLGFRGEALASISSVSRLTLTSRPHDSELAWQASAQGRDMAVDIQPAAASPGTRIEIADLFFNTPARQKFLRTEKTEFNHIEEVFKRHALANNHIAFVLKHNHKIVKRLPAIKEISQQSKRIAAVCGQPFIDNAITFECEHELVQIKGWLGKPDFHRSESDIQYVFINGRPVKDKTLNHAIRQAYEGLLPAGRMATYVINLTIDPQQVDVNVHPTKHEVRFSEQRLIHDLLAKSVADALGEQRGMFESYTANSEQSPVSALSGSAEQFESKASVDKSFSQPEHLTDDAYAYIRNAIAPGPVISKRNTSPRTDKYSSDSTSSKQSLETIVKEPEPKNRQVFETRSSAYLSESQSKAIRLTENYFYWTVNSEPCLVDGLMLFKNYLLHLLSSDNIAMSRAILFPQLLTLDESLLENCECHEQFEKLGFQISPQQGSQLKVNQIPEWSAFLGPNFAIDNAARWICETGQTNQLISEKIIQTCLEDTLKLPGSLVQYILELENSDNNLSSAIVPITAQMLAEYFNNE